MRNRVSRLTSSLNPSAFGLRLGFEASQIQTIAESTVHSSQDRVPNCQGVEKSNAD